MIRLREIEPLRATLLERHGIQCNVSDEENRHILRYGDRLVYVSSSDRGNWLYGLLGAGHHHEDDNVLTDHFIDSVAALLRGESACGACP